MKKSSFSPEVQLDSVNVNGKQIYVVRDDLLEGGTKQRAAVPFIEDLKKKGYTEFVYASPFCGFAQVALASACRSLNVRCILFCEQDRSGPQDTLRPHALSKLARSFGAEIHVVPDLATAISSSICYAKKVSSALLVPLGFDCEEFRFYLRREIKIQWEIILNRTKELGREVQAIWLPVGSGTLVQVFRSLLADNIHIHAVDVHVLPKEDPRLTRLAGLRGLSMESSSQQFAEPADLVPPVASNIFYDAKLWHFIKSEAKAGDIWWNVAR